MNLLLTKLAKAWMALPPMLALTMVAPAMLAPAVYSQTITSGDITGTVADTSGAIVPNAGVFLKNADTGESRTVQTNEAGAYRFNLLRPGTYQISASIPGLRSNISRVIVAVGQVQTFNLTVKPEEAKEVVEVTDTAPLLQADNANLTSTFSTRQIELLPNPGGDITTAAFTVPGISVSTGAGYGNFSSHGLPSTSNLFTLNGNDTMDPYLNVNNSGASNLTLGSNEIQETSVVQNGYSGQYGRQAGAQLNFVTKSGANQFHGNLLYNYNGSAMNANDFFNNASGTPRGRAVSNQYAASIGGPIVKNKLFFFADTEGLRYVLPTAGAVAVPSQAFERYILGNVSAAQVPFYQRAFNLYNNAPGRNRAAPVSNGNGLLQDSNGALGCGSLAGTPTGFGGTLGTDVACADSFGTNVSNQNSEWLFSARVDYNVNDRQKLFARFKTDHGVQPSKTDPISSQFNAVSTQPQFEGQITHTFVISPRMVNNFVGSSSYYSALFGPANLNATLNAFPYELQFFDGGANGANLGGGGLTLLGMDAGLFPQGRRVGQLQLLDDLSYNAGNHSFKAGVNYRYNRVTDTGNGRLFYAGRYRFFGLDEFAAGAINPASGSVYQQRFTPFLGVHLRLYNVGFYGQDEWAATPRLKVTMAVRFDRTGNPYCADHCFALLNAPFGALEKGAGIPYNQSIKTGLAHAFYNTESIIPQPRLGVVYNPAWSSRTVLRGGIGLFSDLFPANVAQNIFANSPNVFTPRILTGLVNAGGAGSAPAIAGATNAAFASGYAAGFTLAELQQALRAQGVAFTPPGYYSVPSQLNSPKYLEWSFEAQQQLGTKNVFTASYVGNRGYDLLLQNGLVNAFANPAAYPNGFGGLPAAAPDPRFRIVNQLANAGYSNYNGLSLSLRRSFAYGFQGQIGYTWSHALDTVSNGGLGEYYSATDSLNGQFGPSIRALNYGNADYDIRHNLTADFFWEIPVKAQNRFAKSALGGWVVSAKLFARTGTPFSVYNSRLAGRISPSVGAPTSPALQAVILADLLDPRIRASCSSVNTACFDASQFASTGTQLDFGNLPRNSFRAPGYFDMDSSLYKNFNFGERVRFTFGASAYNLLNHPNFASPGQDVASSGLGVITATVGPPTSPYGSFQGSAVNGRVLVVTGKFNF